MIRTLSIKHILNLVVARRGRLSSSVFQGSTLKLFAVALLIFGVGQRSTFADSSLDSERDIASLRFPITNPVRDEDDIVKHYAIYLQFVNEVGKEVDAATTRKLMEVYSNLHKRSRRGAALFLKGLRYEMIQRVELSGWNPYALSTRSPEMRRFVARYLSLWLREADEHLFRSYSNQIASRRAAE